MICASVSSPGAEEMISVAGAALEQGAECVEFRIDSMNSPALDSVLSLSSVESETIATFKGESLRLLSGSDMASIFDAFDHIDIPLEAFQSMDIPQEMRRKLILSYHGEIGSLDDASTVIAPGLSSAGIVKCINTSPGYSRSIIGCLAADRTAGGEGRIISFSLGGDGVLSRIASMRRGHPVSYSSVGPSRITAAGQLTTGEMLSAREGLVLGIVGSPEAAGHSLSPAIHGALLSASGTGGVYLRFPVRSGELPGFFEAARYSGVCGFNITMPFKEEALALLDKVDDSAGGIGAVNTVADRNGSFTGYNTDTIAVAEILSEMKPDSALLFGSGGSARAAAHALRGKRVAICARNRTAGSRLVREFGLEQFDGHAGDYDVLVNCTPAGMEGVGVDLPTGLSDGNYSSVIDFVYSSHTPFMDVATRCKASYTGGIEILARQAVHSFALWTGQLLPHSIALSGLGGEVAHA